MCLPHTATVALKALVRHFLSPVAVIVTLIHEYKPAELFIIEMTKIKLFGVYIVVCLFACIPDPYWKLTGICDPALIHWVLLHWLSATSCSEAMLCSKLLKLKSPSEGEILVIQA